MSLPKHIPLPHGVVLVASISAAVRSLEERRRCGVREGRCKGRVGSEERGKRESVCVGTSSSGGIWALGGGKNRSTTLPVAAREHPSPEPGFVPVEETSMK